MRAREQFSPSHSRAVFRQGFTSSCLFGVALLLAGGCFDSQALIDSIEEYNDGLGEASDSDSGASTGLSTGPGTDSSSSTGNGTDSDGESNALPTIDRFLVNGSASPSKLTNYGTVRLHLEASDPEGDFLEVEFFKDGESLGTTTGLDGTFTVETMIYNEPSCTSQPDTECEPAFTFTAVVTHRGDEQIESDAIELGVSLPESRTVAWEYRLEKSGYGSSRAMAVAFDQVGYMYATGSIINDEGREELWIGKYSLHGQEMWFTNFSQPMGRRSEGTSIVLDNQNNVWVAGDRFGMQGGERVPLSSWLHKVRGSDGHSIWKTTQGQGPGETATGISLRPSGDPELGDEIVVVGNRHTENDNLLEGFVRVLDIDGSELRQVIIEADDQDLQLNSLYVHEGSDTAFIGGYTEKNEGPRGHIQKLNLADLSTAQVWGTGEKMVVTDVAATDDRLMATGYSFFTMVDENDVEFDLTYGLAVSAPNTFDSSTMIVFKQTLQPPADESLNAIAFDDKVIVVAGNRSYDDGVQAESISFFPDTVASKSNWYSTWDHYPAPHPSRDRTAFDIKINPTSDFVVIAGRDQRREDPDDEVAVLVSVVR